MLQKYQRAMARWESCEAAYAAAAAAARTDIGAHHCVQPSVGFAAQLHEVQRPQLWHELQLSHWLHPLQYCGPPVQALQSAGEVAPGAEVVEFTGHWVQDAAAVAPW